MGRVVSSATMSIDGYIALPDNTIGPLFDWFEKVLGDPTTCIAAAKVTHLVYPVVK